MICAWNELLSVLPQWMRAETDKLRKSSLTEIHLRLNAPPELVCAQGCIWLERSIHREDLLFTVNAASRYSPWASSGSSQGYLTAPGGHRIGVCGEAVVSEGDFQGIREVRSLCIRVARDFPGLAQRIPIGSRNILILGAPGWGKTTLLRDLSRNAAESKTTVVIDERRELFPAGIPAGKRMDILWGCPKAVGIENVLRAMGPQCIAVDEITAEEDCAALGHAVGCGVQLLATAHASGLEDLHRRPIYRQLLDDRIFETYLILHKDRTYHMEGVCT